MRYKTYFRRTMHNGAVEELPFDGTAEGKVMMEASFDRGLSEETALRLVNGWNRISNGTHQFWIA